MPPTFIQSTSTSYSTTGATATTSSFNVLAGDVLVACSVLTPHAGGVSVAVSNSGTSLDWTEQTVSTSVSSPHITTWTTILSENRTGLTVTFTRAGSTSNHGGTVLTIRNAIGIGTAVDKNTGNGAPTLNVTPEVTDSLLVVVNADYLLVDGSSRVWRTNAGALTELVYHLDSVHGVYLGYHANAGSAIQKAVGLSAPDFQGYAIAAVEVFTTSPGEPGAFTYTKGDR